MIEMRFKGLQWDCRNSSTKASTSHCKVLGLDERKDGLEAPSVRLLMSLHKAHGEMSGPSWKALVVTAANGIELPLHVKRRQKDDGSLERGKCEAIVRSGRHEMIGGR